MNFTFLLSWFTLQVWDGKGFSDCFQDIYPYSFFFFFEILALSFCITILSRYMNWFSLIVHTVLGFAVNVVTIAMILVLGIKQKISGRGTQRSDAQVLVADLVILKGFWEGIRKVPQRNMSNIYNLPCLIFVTQFFVSFQLCSIQ